MKRLIALCILLASCTSVQEASSIYEPEEIIVEETEEKGVPKNCRKVDLFH